ncbi:MAG: hypothetical protein A2542_03185 [Parcubacteria group bacterium RIFOXYD2_FULL_52_8]|nr:MAG: hypothetical protein A2542_03185 [Parcubacteria group bacterium RIFOXYD2_FULL_52_8]
MKPKQASYAYDLCVIGGAGHIGLPLGVAFANAKQRTVLLDVHEEHLEQIRRGIFPFREEEGAQELARALAAKRLHASSDPQVITASKVVVMIIGTPIDEYLNPDFAGILSITEKYLDYFRDGQILILRSTVYPGTTERMQHYFTSRKKNVKVAFCPERIVEGKAFSEFRTIPQIISAVDRSILPSVKKIFSLLGAPEVISVDPMEAELAKLFSNAWRYIKFSVANQFFMIAEDHKLDYYAIHAAMTKGYARNKDLPAPGFAAGPCLLKDTMQLAAFNRNNFFLGHSAMLINEGLPTYLLDQLAKEVPDLASKTIGILGMAFKGESDDARDSLSYKIKKVAAIRAKEVLCHDPYVKDSSLTPMLNEVLERSHVIIIGTPHAAYRKLTKRAYRGKTVVDIWHLSGSKVLTQYP